MNTYDICEECTGLGDDYYVGDDGELVCRCGDCPFNPLLNDENDIAIEGVDYGKF